MLGETLGKYRIEALVGQGGMGTVYRAEHTVIGKRSAIKVLRREYGEEEEVVQRFFNEARAAARIEHPGIIDVYDFGRHRGQAYLVMELLEGEPLSARLKRGPIEPAQARRIARQIAGALAAAHAHEITHRDLKPDNVFLVPDPDVEGGTRVKLLDFGIAKLTEADGSSSVETRTGAVIGTPVYMSPEQCRGSGDVDRRADLYSLGCILYEMLAGSPPFARQGVGELITAHMLEPPEPLQSRAPGIEPALSALVMRLLAKRPEERLQSARDVVRALDGELELDAPRVTVEAPAPSADLPTLLPDDEELPAETHRADSAGAAATAPTAYPTAEEPARTTLSEAASERKPAPAAASRRPPWRSVGLAVLLGGAAVGLWAASKHLGSGGASGPAGTFAPDAAPLREPRLGLRSLAGFRDASGSKASIFTQPGVWKSAAADFAAAAAQPGAPVRWNAAEALCTGYVHLHSGRSDQGLEAMQRAAALAPEWDLAQLGLARALALTGDTEEALAAARRAEALSPEWWLPVAEVANIHREAERLESAVEELQRALVMAPEEPLITSALALLYHAMHMDEAAAEYANQTLERDGDMLAVRLLLAERALEEGTGQTALEHAEHILAVQPKNPPAKLAQADALLLLGREQDARNSYERTLELVDELGPGGAPPTRLEQVRVALGSGHLPQARHLASGSSRGRGDRSRRNRSKKAKDRAWKMADDPLNGF